jgi:hypothetical protein
MINFQIGYLYNDSFLINDYNKDVDHISKVSANLWIKARDTYTFKKEKVKIKAKNFDTQKKIVSLVYGSYLRLPDKNNYSGLILPNESQAKSYQGNGLEFRIGAPLVWLAKLAPNGHFIYHYENTDAYKTTVGDEVLFNTLSDVYSKGHGTKYNHDVKKSKLPNKYILFAHQGLGKVHYYNKMSGFDLLLQVSTWAKDNKKHIVIRIHPTVDEVYTDELEVFKNDYTSFDYDNYIVDLIKGCDQLWTISSACGMEAMLMNKPVTIFGMTDYHPVVNNAATIDDAFKEDFDREEYIRYMTWYVRKLCINIHHPSASDRIYDRMYDYFILGKPIANLY